MGINLASGKNGVLRSGKFPSGQQAFSRIDLMAIIFTVLLLGVWLGRTRMGEYGRTARCAGNLSALGKAMQAYANDNGDTIPAAGIVLGDARVSWDTILLPYLDLAKAKANDKKFIETAPQLFICPSDRVPRANLQRSYALAGNNMLPENWPPSQNSATGIGLYWDKKTVKTLLGYEDFDKPELLPTVKRSNVPAPASTLFLTEFINTNNVMGSPWETRVFITPEAGIAAQRQFFDVGATQFHSGKFNYLMVDGHVESLSPLQTVAIGGSASIWSIKKDN